MVSKLTKYSSIPGLLCFGTGNVLVQKFLFTLKSTGFDAQGNPDEHVFNKPWFQTESMFFGMFFCCFMFAINCLIHKLTNKNKNDVENNLIEKEPEHKEFYWTNIFWALIPAMCDFCSTCFMNIGLFYISASIWQMLRGAMVIFAAILSMIVFKKKFRLYQWLSILSVVFGIIVVGSAPLIKFDENSTGMSGNSDDTSMVILAICLVVFAQVIQAGQMVSEEFLMKRVYIPSTFIVGLEGFWGGSVCALVLFILQHTPTTNKFITAVFHEDTLDTFEMLRNSTPLTYWLIFYIFCCFGYNNFAIMTTETYGAVYRTIIEAARTLCIWIVNIIIYYILKSIYGEPFFGEGISWNSLIELIGFLFIISGSFTYNKIVKLPCVNYDKE
ncbi:hypothetical protein WA158_004269 [Blastocystis sp. Blastoise]